MILLHGFNVVRLEPLPQSVLLKARYASPILGAATMKFLSAYVEYRFKIR